MAHKPRGIGHNREPLTEDEQAALTTYYRLKIAEAQRTVDELAVDLRSARGVVNSQFKRMTADLQFSREEFQREAIATLNMTEAEYRGRERKRARLHRLAGLQTGEQLDLVDLIKDTVDDEIDAETNGYRAGRRADDPVPPTTLSPMFIPAWMRGWDKGQEENGALLARAGEIIAARDLGMAGRGEDEDLEDDADAEGLAGLSEAQDALDTEERAPTTIDEARAALEDVDEPPASEPTTRKGKPKGAAARDPLLAS